MLKVYILCFSCIKNKGDGDMWYVLKQLLKERQMTIVELSKISGVHRNTIMNIRSRKISFYNMAKIATALDVSMDVFK